MYQGEGKVNSSGGLRIPKTTKTNLNHLILPLLLDDEFNLRFHFINYLGKIRFQLVGDGRIDPQYNRCTLDAHEHGLSATEPEEPAGA